MCAPGRSRTCDLWVRNPALYPLNYGRNIFKFIIKLALIQIDLSQNKS